MMVQEKAIPFSIESEEAVLGSILMDAESIYKVIDILEPRDFFGERNSTVYRAMVNLYERGDRIDEVTVGYELDRVGEPELIPLLLHFVAVTPTYLDIEHYADVVRRCSFYRQLLVVAGQIGKIAIEQDPNLKTSIDKCDNIIQELRQKSTTESRRLVLGKPRLIQTNPPRYIWNVNGKDLRLTLRDITQYGRFKNIVISELNFVPIKPKDWDNVINALITHSLAIEAPIDASEEQQLKIAIKMWFDRMREAGVYSDLSVGRHIIKEVGETTYYFFQSTPLLNYLKKEYKRHMNSEDLWVLYVSKWGGIKYQIRVKKPAGGSQPAYLWGIPMDFVEEEKKAVPDWF